MTYGFIGTGNMGGALARALVKTVSPADIFLNNRTMARAEALAAELGIQTGFLTLPEAAEALPLLLGKG